MATKAEQFPYIGTGSHGTLLDRHLIARFMGALEVLKPVQARALKLAYSHWRMYGIFDAYGHDAQELLNDLIDSLDGCAPTGYYFGAHPGDGSDFGFWPCEEYDLTEYL